MAAAEASTSDTRTGMLVTDLGFDRSLTGPAHRALPCATLEQAFDTRKGDPMVHLRAYVP